MLIQTNAKFKDFFTVEGLQTTTGVQSDYFGDVLAKELIDNALDASSQKVEWHYADHYLEVRDWGPGITKDTLTAWFDFNTYATSKVFLKCERGTFGNAWKTIAGISWLHQKSIEIASQGIQYTVLIQVNKTQEQIFAPQIKISPSEITEGTRIRVYCPTAPQYILARYPFVNHAIPPLKQTHIAFYTSERFVDLLQKWAYLTPKTPLNQFLFIHFKGFSKAKIKAIITSLMGTENSVPLSEIEAHLPALYHILKTETKPNSLNLLSQKCFGSHWKQPHHHYKKINLEQAVLEICLVPKHTSQLCVYLNNSPTFPGIADKFAFIQVGQKRKRSYLKWFIQKEFPNHLALIHVICPNLTFISKGKDFYLNPAIREAIDSVLSGFAKRKKPTQTTHQTALPTKHSQKAAAFEYLDESIRYATSDLKITTSIRNVFYAVRERIIKKYGVASVPKYEYFTPNLVNQFFKAHPEHKELEHYINYKETGFIYFPDGSSIRDNYLELQAHFEVNPLKYNKALFIEKSGLAEGFKHSQFMARYDCLLITGQGYASRAIRYLLKELFEHHITLFCLHDLDLDGLDILRTLQEGTATVEDQNIQVIDLGFSSQDIEVLKVIPEQLNKAPQAHRLEHLLHSRIINEKTAQFLKDRKRAELNAVTNLQLVAFTEKKFKRMGYDEKVLPPAPIFQRNQKQWAKHRVSAQAKDLALKILAPKIESMTQDFIKQLSQALPAHEAEKVYQEVAKTLSNNPPESWEGLMKSEVNKDIRVAIQELERRNRP